MNVDRLWRMKLRRPDPETRTWSISESHKRSDVGENVDFAIAAMTPIDAAYNLKTFEEGDRIRSQLDRLLNTFAPTVQFEYQGSVSNGTNIKTHTDLDILVISTAFCFESPYDPIRALRDPNRLLHFKNLKAACARDLRRRYPMGNINEDRLKCLALNGLGLRRQIDLVFASWWNTLEYQKTSDWVDRGVVIYSADGELIENKPFLHNVEIDRRDKEVGGNLRKVIRLLKALKHDVIGDRGMSSYNMTAIAFNMPDSFLSVPSGSDLILVERINNYLYYLLNNPASRLVLRYPNGMRTGLLASVYELRDLFAVTDRLLYKLNKELKGTSRQLGESKRFY